jgi:hypothetical protein
MRHHSTPWIVMAALCGVSTLAQAAPPTAVPSPGYDARLQEQRAATHGAATIVAPVTSPATMHRHAKKKHAN